jgi:PTH1 family peptidyl-tRNA hydrolase
LEGRIQVVVGLGNPGPRYERTRHNIGFRCIDHLARVLDAPPGRDEGDYQVTRVPCGDRELALVKPMTFMNRSGQALLRFPDSALAGPGGHLVILDDVWLPFGAVRFRREGGDGGHNGLASVLAGLGTEEVPRLRLGVSGAETEGDLADYVLEDFSEEEEKSIEDWLARASQGVQVFIKEGPDAAMTRFNG